MKELNASPLVRRMARIGWQDETPMPLSLAQAQLNMVIWSIEAMPEKWSRADTVAALKLMAQ